MVHVYDCMLIKGDFQWKLGSWKGFQSCWTTWFDLKFVGFCFILQVLCLFPSNQEIRKLHCFNEYSFLIKSLQVLVHPPKDSFCYTCSLYTNNKKVNKNGMCLCMCVWIQKVIYNNQVQIVFKPLVKSVNFLFTIIYLEAAWRKQIIEVFTMFC